MIRFLCTCIFFLSVSHSLIATWQNELRVKIAQAKTPQWMIEQIEEDLAPFKEHGVSEKQIWETLKNYPEHGFILCKIKNRRFSWISHPSVHNEDSRAHLFAAAMEQLTSAVSLPDMFFIVFVGEAFCEQASAPVFSWCKHCDWSPSTVCIPDYEALNGNYHFLAQMYEGVANYPWNKKKNKAFWRGGTTGGWGFKCMPRLELVRVSDHYPELIDAKFSGLFQSQYDHLEERALFLPYTGSSISIADHIQYKYQILVDGHVSAFSRAYWQLFSGCVIFKHASPWYQWFYRALRPYEHYIPYQADATDLIDKIIWAYEHDEKAHTIAQNAVQFAENNLKYSDIMLYVYLLFSKYAELQK